MNTIRDDLLVGAAAIGAFWGCSKRRAFYLCERGNLPAFKVGRIWHARKSTLIAHVRRLEGDERDGADATA